ncbi:aldehyde oxidase GLOX-like [Panicum virgatum]|uniref:Galactose oxidase n=1 Tax=Panicum virgatum TaxID=38727 RepID=A0A8T0QH85_PANVG|nr:aldehyde oxidase GLOX-like [Panicum virgatum]KAG2573083.1 hypothetical protein PVAP13_7KG225700 [Panicum virgatum]
MKLGFHHLALLLLLAYGSISPAFAAGSWKFLQNVGVSGMHMQLLHNDRLILFDRTNVGPSNLTFPTGHPCRTNPQDLWFRNRTDCTAHSVEYSVASGTFRGLSLFTDTWCSSGHVAPDGTLVQNGGWRDGTRKIRLMPACSGGSDATCDWTEEPAPVVLAADRWYATNQKLPDGRAIIVGGLGQPSYEFYPKAGTNAAFSLPFLGQTNSLYPFVHLNIDGNLFIFAGNRAILFDYNAGKIVRNYTTLGDGGDLRTNPNAGSSVLLPLKPNPTEAEVLICGGTPATSNGAVAAGQFPPALRTCGRLKITDTNPSWVVEEMPSPRVMGDMILLPNGEVAIINGATDGIAGWDSANTFNPTPVIYRPDLPFVTPTSRFEAQAPAGTPRPRMYHASAVLDRDGRVIVGGSNPHQFYVFDKKFPTDLTLEAFAPFYLDAPNDGLRPNIFVPSPKDGPVHVTYGAQLKLQFFARVGVPGAVTMVAPSFTTHSFAQNQRQLFLQVQVKPTQAFQLNGGVATPFPGFYEATVTMPATAVLAPPGYYMLFVVNGRIPSKGIWVHIQ